MRSLNNQEINSIHGGMSQEEFANITMYYGAAVGTTAGAIFGAIKLGMGNGFLWAPLGFVGGGFMGAALGTACGAVAIIPLSVIFCPPDYSNLFIDSRKK